MSLENGFDCGSMRYQAVTQQKKKNGDMSETATLIPKGVKKDIAYSQRCVQHTYVPTSWMSVQIFHTQAVSFLSHSDSIFLVSSTTVL